MIFNNKNAALILLAGALASCVRHNAAQVPPPGAAEAKTAFYVPAEIFKSADFPPPPAMDSEAQKADIAAVTAWQEKRTETDCARSSVTAEVSYPYLWGEKSPFPEPLPPEVKAFFERVSADTEEAAYELKNRFRRARPYNAYSGVKPCIKKSGSYSYPSGHSSFANVYANVLGDLVPERKNEFVGKAGELALDRVIGGVHYPADIEAGKLFGGEFHSKLLKNPYYLKDIENIKTFLVR
jgi:acid phosphatase (class A)